MNFLCYQKVIAFVVVCVARIMADFSEREVELTLEG